MGEGLHRQRRIVPRGGMGAGAVGGQRDAAFAQFDRGTISGTIKDAQGGVVPGVTVTATATQTQQTRSTVTDGSGFYTFPNLHARALRHLRRAAGVQERDSHRRAGRRRVGAQPRVHARDRRADRGSHGDRPRPRCCRPTSPCGRRSRPRTSSCCRSSAATRLACPRSRPASSAAASTTPAAMSLTTGGFNINGGRVDENVDLRGRRRRDPHPIGRRDHRRAERRHRPGSPGADRQLHARVRARERRPDPVRHQERQQPLLRQRLVLLSRRIAAGQHLGAQPQPERDGEFRPGAVRLQAVRVLVRRPDPGGDVQGQAVLLRRAGVGRLLPGLDQYRDRADSRRCGAEISASCSGRIRSSAAPQIIRDPADRPAVPRKHHPAGLPVAERDWRS